MAANAITRVSIVLSATINDTPRTFTSNFDMNAAQGGRLQAFLQSEFGADPDTGAPRNPQGMADAFADALWSFARRLSTQWLRAQAAAAEPEIAFTRS